MPQSGRRSRFLETVGKQMTSNLAEALRALGYVQRFGAGIAIARKALGERLRFEVQPGFVAAIIRGEIA